MGLIKGTSRSAYLFLILISSLGYLSYRAIANDKVAPLSAGLMASLRTPQRIVTDRFNLEEGGYRTYGFTLDTDARIQVTSSSSYANINVMLMNSHDLAVFKKINDNVTAFWKKASDQTWLSNLLHKNEAKDLGGKIDAQNGAIVCRHSLSQFLTMRMDKTETLPSGEWYVVVRYPRESLTTRNQSTVDLNITAY
jgi:hypothetical protein